MAPIFGRFSDSFKPKVKINSWNDCMKFFEEKKYFDSYFIDSMINDDDPEPDGLEQLTAREREILCEIGRGMNNRMISEKFCISEHTVKKHINHIFDKLNIRDRTQAALFANNCGILSRDVC
jgi:two-component system nitrate/nitrite response regulator NarL